MIAGSISISLKCIGDKLCLCAALLPFLFQPDLGRQNSAGFNKQGRQLLLTFLTVVTRWSCSTSNFYALVGQNLTDEFMQKIFVSSCNAFNYLCPLDVQNEIKLLSRFFCYSWPLVKVIGNPISDGIVFVAPSLMRKRVEKSQAILALLDGW